MIKLKRRQLRDTYRFPGFVPLTQVVGVFGDSHAVVVSLRRRRKKQSAVNAVEGVGAITIGERVACEICRAVAGASIWNWRYDG